MIVKDPHTRRRIGRRRFIKSWAWPGEVEAFLREQSQGLTIHVCNGSSTLGDVTIDKYMPADILGDMFVLPIKTGVADTVVCDPPWGIGRDKRMKFICELRRILKIHGRLLFNAPWVPHVPGLRLLEVWMAVSLMPQNDCGIITISEKSTVSMFNDR